MMVESLETLFAKDERGNSRVTRLSYIPWVTSDM